MWDNRKCQFGFQSTLPLRGATECDNSFAQSWAFQSTLPLRGATWYLSLPTRGVLFQSTLPLRGATLHHLFAGSVPADFNPRSPYGERPPITHPGASSFRISIHAPLTGSDDMSESYLSKLANFNPRSPYGERPMVKKKTI